MFVSYSDIIDSARVWIYYSHREFSDEEKIDLDKQLLKFCQDWKAHGVHLKSSYTILFNRFIILLVDESVQKITGCSIDSSVQLLKSIEDDFDLELFNRKLIVFEQADKIETLLISDFKKIINPNTIVFNSLVRTKKELESNFRVTVENSWHSKLF